MKSSISEIVPIIGTSMGGGFYAGRIKIADAPFALIVAPKADGDHKDAAWIAGGKSMPDALSYFDGVANTKAIAEAGSKLAQWALDLRIGGFDDWYLPSLDELEICYRNLKPTTVENWCYARSGVNLSALEPTYPYAPHHPVQTLAKAFLAGGAQAFESAYYWTSTQHASASDYAWYQGFSGGNQCFSTQASKLRARAVRRLPL